MSNDKQVELTDEVAAVLDTFGYMDGTLSIFAMRCSDNRLLYYHLIDIGYLATKLTDDRYHVTESGQRALEAYKAQQQIIGVANEDGTVQSFPSPAYQRNEVVNDQDTDWGGNIDNWRPLVNRVFAEHMYMWAAWFYGGIELHKCDDCEKEEIAKEIESAIKAYKAEAEGK